MLSPETAERREAHKRMRISGNRVLNPLFPALKALVTGGKWAEANLERRAWFNQMKKLEKDGLITRKTIIGITTQYRFNLRLVKRIFQAKGMGHLVTRDLLAIPGTELRNPEPVDGVLDELAHWWLWEGRPMESCCMETAEDHATYRVAKCFQEMADVRCAGRAKRYFHETNPKQSRYWTSFGKVSAICQENEIEPEDFLEAQFFYLNLEFCKNTWHGPNPPPNMLHSLNALPRYHKYVKECGRRMDAPRKLPTTMQEWLRRNVHHAVYRAVDSLVNQLRLGGGALVGDNPDKTRRSAIIRALDSSHYSGALLCLTERRSVIKQVEIEDKYTILDFRNFVDVRRVTSEPEAYQALRQHYEQVKALVLNTFENRGDGPLAEEAVRFLDDFVNGTPYQIPVVNKTNTLTMRRTLLGDKGRMTMGKSHGHLSYGRAL